MTKESIPKAPGSLPATARAEWLRIAPMLHERGLLAGHQEVFAAYCIHAALLRSITSSLITDGIFLEGRDDQVNPLLCLQHRTVAVMLGLGRLIWI